MWVLVAALTLAVFVTYARLPADQLYNVSGSGLRGGLSRVVVELNFPDALIALGILGVAWPKPRWLATLAAALPRAQRAGASAVAPSR